MASLALLQNSVGIGGRSQVLAHAISTLTDPDKEVHLFTLSGPEGFDEFVSYYGLSEFDISLRTFPGLRSIPAGTLYQQPLLNLRAGRALSRFDRVFNSNNCLGFLPSGPEYVHYVHLPTPAIPRTNTRYSGSPLLQFYALPLSALTRIVDPPAFPNGSTLVNSEFTSRAYESAYGREPDGVVYPPSIESVDLDGFGGTGVVTLGSFHPNKNQRFQLEVARELPDTRFTLIGSKASPDYYQQCVEYVETHGLSNVDLKPDAPARIVGQSLNGSEVFLHSMENEPFGISTVEAMNHGCIPVVHDSGGQREIVTSGSLRYDGVDECTEIIRRIESGTLDIPTGRLRRRLHEFTFRKFRERLASHLDGV